MVQEIMSTAPAAFDRAMAISIYSDMYKDRYNVRPRHIDWNTKSDEDIVRMTNDLESVPFAED